MFVTICALQRNGMRWNAMQHVIPVRACLEERHTCTAQKVPVHVPQALTP